MEAFWQSLKGRWRTYSRADQALWLGLSVAALVVLLWLYVWQPMAERYQQAQEEVARAEATLAWVQRAAPQVRANQPGELVPSGNGQTMTNVVTRSASQHDLALSRFEQDGQNGLRFWMDQQPFDQVMLWVATLDTQGIEIDQLTVSQGNSPGHVNVRGVAAR